MDLAARYADGWNWWSAGPPDRNELRNTLDELDRRCVTADRDPGTLRRSLDVYSVDPLGVGPPEEVMAGGPDEIARQLLELAALGFDEVRCNLAGRTATDRIGSIQAMAGVVEAVHADAPSGGTSNRQMANFSLPT